MTTSSVTYFGMGVALLVVPFCLHGCGGGDSPVPSPTPPSPTPPGSPGAGDYPGHGVSKSTYSCNDPISGWNFLNKYFPVDTPTDECQNNVCDCAAKDSNPAWQIQQGRVYAKRAGASGPGGHAGNGFGLHLVNVSQHWTTGGLSTGDVEQHFTEKLGDMSKYDAFMDYNVVFFTEGLDAYKSTFQADGVKFFEGTWDAPDSTSYTSVIIRVPGTQMVLELVGKSTASTKDADHIRLEQRVPASALPLNGTPAMRVQSSATVGSIISPMVVNRAASAASMAQLEDFYVSGMGTTLSHHSSADGVVKKCFLWPGATVHVCYSQRDDSATKGEWKVADFENMLNTVHKTLMDGHPFCGMDKWEDNHYAIDSRTADTSKIVAYINSKKPYHLCQSASSGPPGPGQSGSSGPPGPGGGSSTTVHYIWDPTGWGIQLDLRFTTVPDDCKHAPSSGLGSGNEGHENPACTLEPANCGGQSTASLLV